MRSFSFAGNHGESLENRGISRDKREERVSQNLEGSSKMP